MKKVARQVLFGCILIEIYARKPWVALFHFFCFKKINLTYMLNFEEQFFPRSLPAGKSYIELLQDFHALLKLKYLAKPKLFCPPVFHVLAEKTVRKS